MPTTTTHPELTAEMRAALEDEAKYLSFNIGDELDHIDKAVEHGEVASEILKAQAPRIQLAVKLWECVETGRLDVIARAFHLDEMVELVEIALEGELRELATDRDHLQETIIRGVHPMETATREEQIAYYHEQIETIKARVRGQRAFLALAAAEKERAAQAIACGES